MDTLTPKQRSHVMSLVRAANTRPELAVRRLVHRLGFRFRLGRRDIPGTPDLALPRHRVAIFVHGCFWHRHAGCENTRTPKTRVAFWRNKFEGNVRRDRAVRRRLGKAGWRVLVIWECETKNLAKLENRVRRFMGASNHAVD